MIRHWTIAVVVAAQLAVLAAIPAKAMRTRANGIDVTLWTAPVDPYDVMSGYYVTLSYEVERPAADEHVSVPADAPVWITVRRGDPAWTPVSITADRPAAKSDEISMRATWRGLRAELDTADRVYVPESRRERASRLLTEAKGRALVDMKVDADGDVSVLRMRVGGETFGK